MQLCISSRSPAAAQVLMAVVAFTIVAHGILYLQAVSFGTRDRDKRPQTPQPTTKRRDVPAVSHRILARQRLNCYPPGTRAATWPCECARGWTGPDCGLPTVMASFAHMLTPLNSPVRVVNGLTFNQEFDILQVRLEEIAAYVDYFIVVESMFTHLGTPKPLYFNDTYQSLDWLKPYLPKIIHVIVSDLPEGGVHTWENEVYTREGISRGIDTIGALLQPDDWIVINDADEIPSEAVIRALKMYTGFPSPHLGLTYRWSAYGFFWLNIRDVQLPTAVTYEFYQNELIANNSHHVRVYHSGVYYVGTLEANETTVRETQWCGWHCSWCFMDYKQYVNKLTSALRGDGERWGDHPEMLNEAYLAENRRLGRWFDGGLMIRQYHSKQQPLFAPRFVLEQQQKFAFLLNV